MSFSKHASRCNAASRQYCWFGATSTLCTHFRVNTQQTKLIFTLKTVMSSKKKHQLWGVRRVIFAKSSSALDDTHCDRQPCTYADTPMHTTPSGAATEIYYYCLTVSMNTWTFLPWAASVSLSLSGSLSVWLSLSLSLRLLKPKQNDKLESKLNENLIQWLRDSPYPSDITNTLYSISPYFLFVFWWNLMESLFACFPYPETLLFNYLIFHLESFQKSADLQSMCHWSFFSKE